MKWVAYHNGQEINYFLGIAIAFDQFGHSLFPGADIDRTISHRLGLKKVKLAIKKGLVSPLCIQRLPSGQRVENRVAVAINAGRIRKIKLSGIPGLIDRMLDKIDKDHSFNAIGA